MTTPTQTKPVDVLSVMASAADGMEGVIESEGHYFEDSEPVAMREARAAVAELIEAAKRALGKAWEYGEDEPHFVRLNKAIARVRGEA